MKSDIIDVSVQLMNETAAAVRVTTSTPDEGVWLPRSLIEIEPADRGGLHIVSMPEWLALQKGLI